LHFLSTLFGFFVCRSAATQTLVEQSVRVQGWWLDSLKHSRIDLGSSQPAKPQTGFLVNSVLDNPWLIQ
jgi:hypothetical protein